MCVPVFGSLKSKDQEFEARGEEMAHWVNSLLHKHKDVNLGARHDEHL